MDDGHKGFNSFSDILLRNKVSFRNRPSYSRQIVDAHLGRLDIHSSLCFMGIFYKNKLFVRYRSVVE